MINRYLLPVLLIVMPGFADAEMKALEDDMLSEVSGQAGITADLATKFEVGEIAYFDDGLGIALQGVKMSSAADPAQLAEYRLEFDILSDGDLFLTFSSQNTARFEIEDIRFVDTPGIVPAATDLSIGGIFFEYQIDGSLHSYNRGSTGMGVNNTVGGLYDLDFVIRDGRFGYQTNGNEFFLDGLELDVNSLGTIFGVTPAGQLNLSMPNLLAELRVDAMRFSGAPTLSYGSLWVDMDLNTDLLISAGGADGSTGMTINSSTLINRMDLAWGDDTNWGDAGYWMGALGITGSVNLTNLTVDVLDDTDTGAQYNGLGLALAFERLAVDLHVGDLVLGETKSNIDNYISGSLSSIKSVGSFDVNLTFANTDFNGTPYTNRVLVQAGGYAGTGNQGLRLDTQLAVAGSSNESNFIYTDTDPDGRKSSIMFSGFQAFIDGDITVDVTSAATTVNDVFYDGLRIGFEDLAFGYQIEGIRVGQNTGNEDDLKNEELRSTQRISGMPGLIGAPSLEGTLNGHITLGPGGKDGDGISINSDVYVTDGAMASYLQADGSGSGLWLSGLNYDVHLRDMKLDVTSEGLNIYETESWSKLDVTDFRIGDKIAGASFGGLIVETFERGSETIVSAGGAGTVCIGGVGSDSAACESDGGRWEDRGAQGITVASRRHLQRSETGTGDQRNRFTWVTDRQVDGGGSIVEGSGLKLIFDNYSTNDGNDLTDDFGIQTTYNLDVARTRVIKKSTGFDSNNVYGEEGWEKVMLADGSYEYRAPGSVNASDRPIGVAVRTNTQFKELDFDSVKLGYHNGAESTLLYGLKLQNFNITTDLTATPMD